MAKLTLEQLRDYANTNKGKEFDLASATKCLACQLINSMPGWSGAYYNGDGFSAYHLGLMASDALWMEESPASVATERA